MRNLLDHIGQQGPPEGGYSIARFEGYIQQMEDQVERLQSSGDARVIFEITYSIFSRQVLEALKARRFEDTAWATDMACRFIEVYRQQSELWQARHPALCRPWRVAFEAMEQGRVNALQAMLLGINAHINYDLAFVTLGACRAAGDLDGTHPTGRALTSSLTGVPVVRYRDYLLINQLEWEAIALIQDTVLRQYSRLLYWPNRLSMRVSRFAGQRMLMEARDRAWYQTALLVHARDDGERQLVGRLIADYATSLADVVGVISIRPDHVIGHLFHWTRRDEKFSPELQAGLTDMAHRNPVVAELVLRELALAGADPVQVLQRLRARGDIRLSGQYVSIALASTPRRSRQRLVSHLRQGSDHAITVVEAMLEAGLRHESLPRGAPVKALCSRWAARLADDLACLDLPAVRDNSTLRQALESSIRDLRQRLHDLGTRKPVLAARLTPRSAATRLSRHPDAWVRACVAEDPGLRPPDSKEGGEPMVSVIERVLFLKETQIFMEVDIAVLVRVAECLESRSYRANQPLLRSGESPGGIYLIREGQVEVSQTRDGQEIRIAVLGPRDCIGELSALNEIAATATCTPLTPGTCWFLPSQHLSNLLHQYPRLGIGLIRVLSQRLIHTTRSVQEPEFLGPPPPIERETHGDL